jgi:hypothetical protein
VSTGAHLFALAATIPSLVLILTLVRRGSMRVKYAMLWVPVCIAMIVFAAVPGLLDSLAGTVGVAYPPTVLFVLALGLLIFVSVHLSWELSRLDERVRRLAEHVAIMGVEHGDSEHGSGVESTVPRAERVNAHTA